MCSAVRLLSASKAAGHLALRDRMIAAVRHVLFARPQQLDRRARHLLGDHHGLTDVVGLAAPAEAAAEHQLVDVAFVGRQAGRLQHRGERRFAVLRAAPDLAFVRPCRARSRSSAPWWRGSGRDSCRPPRPSLRRLRARPSRRRSGCRHRPGRSRDPRRAIARSRPLETLAFSPSSQTIGSASSAVLACHQVSATTATAVSLDPHHLLDALHVGDLGFVEALQLAAGDRAILDRGVEHAGQLDVDAVDHRAGDLVGGVEPLDALADQLPVLRILQLDVGRRRQLRGGFGDLAVGRGPARRRVRDDAVGGGAFAKPAPSIRWPRPGSASCARWRRPCGHSPARCGCRGCRRCEKSPQTRLRATFWPGVGYSVVTLDQSHSSSSATSWARPVSVPWPISERAMRITTVSSGRITTQALTSGEPSAARTSVRPPKGISRPSARPAPSAAVPITKARRLSLGRQHACSWLPPSRVARGVDRLAHLLEGAAAADIGDGVVDVLVGRLRLVLQAAPPPP